MKIAKLTVLILTMALAASFHSITAAAATAQNSGSVTITFHAGDGTSASTGYSRDRSDDGGGNIRSYGDVNRTAEPGDTVTIIDGQTPLGGSLGDLPQTGGDRLTPLLLVAGMGLILAAGPCQYRREAAA